jgi:hypothetical protein
VQQPGWIDIHLSLLLDEAERDDCAAVAVFKGVKLYVGTFTAGRYYPQYLCVNRATGIP